MIIFVIPCIFLIIRRRKLFLIVYNYYDCNQIDDKFTEVGIGSKLSCLLLNCSSFASHFDSIQFLITLLKFSLDILVFSETWLADSCMLLYKIPGYKSVYKQHASGYGGGLCVYVKENYDTSVISNTFHSNYFKLLEIKICSSVLTNPVFLCAISRPTNSKLKSSLVLINLRTVHHLRLILKFCYFMIYINTLYYALCIMCSMVLHVKLCQISLSKLVMYIVDTLVLP